jgi:hypothetical protein
MDSIRGHFVIMGGVLWIPSVAILALWVVVYYEFHPWAIFGHYGWCIMDFHPSVAILEEVFLFFSFLKKSP